MESGIGESCCTIYDSLDCIQKEAANVCNGTELTDMDNYKKKSLVAFSTTMCKTVPYEQRAKLCTPNKCIGNCTGNPLTGGSHSTLPSFLSLFGAILIFVRVYY